MPTLREVLPQEFFSSFMDTRAAKMLDVEVEREYDLGGDDWKKTWESWPGPHKNVLNWWKLVDGRCVGWNENPSTGWAFPVYGTATK